MRGKQGGVILKYIRVLLIMISFILIFMSVVSVAAEYQKDDDIYTLSPRYAIPMSLTIGLNFQSDDPYLADLFTNISVDSGDVDYFILRVVLEKYSGSGYTVVKTWRDVKATVDSNGIAFFGRSYRLSEHGSYRIRVSGDGYIGSKCVVTFINKTSKTVTC